MERQAPHPDRVFTQIAGILTLLLGMISLYFRLQSTIHGFSLFGSSEPIWLFFEVLTLLTNVGLVVGGIALLVGGRWGWTLATTLVAFGLVMIIINIGVRSQSEHFQLTSLLDFVFLLKTSLRIAALVFLLLPATRQSLSINSRHFIIASAVCLGLVVMQEVMEWSFSSPE